MQYFLNILYSLDVFANTVAGGSPHHSISGRCGWWDSHDGGSVYWFERRFIDLVFDAFNGRSHCYQAARLEIDHSSYEFERGLDGWALLPFVIAGVVLCAVPALIYKLAGGKPMQHYDDPLTPPEVQDD